MYLIGHTGTRGQWHFVHRTAFSAVILNLVLSLTSGSVHTSNCYWVYLPGLSGAYAKSCDSGSRWSNTCSLARRTWGSRSKWSSMRNLARWTWHVVIQLYLLAQHCHVF